MKKLAGVRPVLVAMAVLLTTGCGGGGGGEGAAAEGRSVEDVLEEVGDLSVDERRARLIDLAKEEGASMTVYTTTAGDINDEVSAAFTEATGVQLLSYRADAEDVRTRILQESAAGRLAADVTWIGDSRLIPVRDAGLLAPYTSPHQADLVEGSVSEFWTINHYNLYVPAWNTDAVAPDEAPTSWEDLADPVWDNRLTLEASDFDWYWSVSNYLAEDLGRSEEEIDQYWADVVDGADFNSGHTSTRQLLIAGEYDLFASDFSNGVEAGKSDGAPVEWLPPVEPLFATPEAAAILNTSANPATSILFMDWLISDGQDVLRELAYDVTRKDLLSFDADADLRFIDAERWFEVEADVIDEYSALAAS
jgi:iron(III) transport system substrate-binding protein